MKKKEVSNEKLMFRASAVQPYPQHPQHPKHPKHPNTPALEPWP